MNGSIPGRGRVLAALAAGVTLLAAACGGGGGSPSASGSSAHEKLVAFAECMRSHGVPDWPDPLPQGGFPRKGDHTPLFDSAWQFCQHLLPPPQPPNAAQQAQQMAHGLKFARCMRSHGIPGFPDPSAAGDGLSFPLPPGFDWNSPRVQAAQNACKRDSKGLPVGPPHGG
jgi:hypothetical protein